MTKRKAAATRRSRAGGPGRYVSKEQAARLPAAEVVSETTPRAIYRGWIEVDDDGKPNGDIQTGTLSVYKKPSCSHGEWNAQYVRLVKARPPRKKKPQ